VTKAAYYTGPVCYLDGWHYTVVPNPDGLGNGDKGHVYDAPGEKLVLEDNEDGTEFRYRLATDEDTRSWHDRKHRAFATVEYEDGEQPGLRVTADDMAAIREFLETRKAGE